MLVVEVFCGSGEDSPTSMSGSDDGAVVTLYSDEALESEDATLHLLDVCEVSASGRVSSWDVDASGISGVVGRRDKRGEPGLDRGGEGGSGTDNHA